MKSYQTKTIDSKTTITGAQYLTNILEELNVETVFGYPGAPVLPIYESLSKCNIKHILSRHEHGAIHAAEGYAKIKDKPGVVLVTSGPGFSNTITGIMNAYADGTPLVVIAGRSEEHNINEFQDIDVQNISKTFTKRVYQINTASDIESSIKKAFIMANKVPKAPVVVTVKKSALLDTIIEKTPYRIKKGIKVEAPHSCILKTIDLLKNAEKPLIIAGGGCRNLDKELIELANLTNIPIVNTLMFSGLSSNLSMGMIGINGNVELNEYINQADIVLSLGVRFTNRTTQNAKEFLPNAKIININIDTNKSKNVSIHKEIIGDLNVVLQQIIGVIKSKNILFDIKYDWINTLSTCSVEYNNNEFNKDSVLKRIFEYTKSYNPIITTDIGEHQIAAAKLFKKRDTNMFLTSGGFGSMGFGLPAAIGAQIAKQNALVMNITGDGSFQMNMQELGTIAEYNLPVKIFIMNNSSLGMIKTQQINSEYNIYQSNLLNPDFANIAKSYGIQSYCIHNFDELDNVLKEIFKYKKAVLIDIKL